jgi:hypothetical protein
LLVQRRDLDVERLCHRDRNLDLLTRRIRNLDRVEPGAAFAAEQMQLGALRQPVVIEHRTDALLPLAALIDKRVTQPDLRAQIQDVVGRDPRLRQPPDHQQLPQMLRISAVALGSLLLATQRTRLRRLTQMNAGPNQAQLLNDEPPARRRLERNIELLTGEPAKKTTDTVTVRRRHPRPPDLTSLGVDPLRRDLRSVLIQSHYDRHQGPPQAPRSEHLRELSALELRRPCTCHLCARSDTRGEGWAPS